MNEQDEKIERVIRKYGAWGHVAIWYVEAVIDSFMETGLWLTFRKNGTLSRAHSVSRVVGDLYQAMYGKELTSQILKSAHGWNGKKPTRDDAGE